MALQDAWRRAAGLLFENVPEPSESELREADELIENDTPLISPSARPVGAKVATAKTVEQIVREADGPNLDEIASRAPDVAVAADKTVTPDDIYAAAKLPPSAFGAEQMLDMLQSLPKELPLDTKRATVKVTLSALGKSAGATAETIVADASRKMAALAAYSEHLTRRATEFATREEASIAELQKQIEAKRASIVQSRQNSERAMQSCKAEAERLEDVLEFFSLDVAPSKHAVPTAPAPTASAANAPGGAQQKAP